MTVSEGIHTLEVAGPRLLLAARTDLPSHILRFAIEDSESMFRCDGTCVKLRVSPFQTPSLQVEATKIESCEMSLRSTQDANSNV